MGRNLQFHELGFMLDISWIQWDLGFPFQVVVSWEFHGDCNGDYNEDDIWLMVYLPL